MRDHLLGYPAAMAWIDPKPPAPPKPAAKRQQSAFQKAANKVADREATAAYFLKHEPQLLGEDPIQAAFEQKMWRQLSKLLDIYMPKKKTSTSFEAVMAEFEAFRR